MSILLEKFADASTVAFVGVIVGVIGVNMRWLASSRKIMAQVLESVGRDGRSIHILYRLQGPQISAMRATLEALRDGRCNGNVDQALVRIEEAERTYSDHLIGHVGAQHAPEIPK